MMQIQSNQCKLREVLNELFGREFVLENGTWTEVLAPRPEVIFVMAESTDDAPTPIVVWMCEPKLDSIN